MGETVTSYRMALECEISRWRNFRGALSRVEEKQAFDALMDICRNYAMAGGNACNPIIFEPKVMSILLEQQKRIRTIEKELDIKQQAADIPEPN